MSQVSEMDLQKAGSRALQVFASMRTYGARFYREYMGIQSSLPLKGVGEASMPASPHTLGPRGFVAPGALATLADVALASSIRAFVAPRSRTATVGLTLQIVREVPTELVRARAEVVSGTSHTAVSQCHLTDDSGKVLALATGTFAIRPVPETGPWLPYAQDSAIAARDVVPVDPKELRDDELWLLKHVEVSLGGECLDGPYANYLRIEWLSRGTGRATAIWPLGPHLWNRVAHVHGGAIFGALAVAAAASLPENSRARVVEQHVQFARPGRGEALRVEANLLRRGQQLTSVHAQIVAEDDRSVASALVTLEVAADG